MAVNCIEARRMVSAYVNKELSAKETEAFLDHIAHCSDCMDELDVYFTVYRALNSLDASEHHEFNFKKMLEEDIRMERRSLFRKKTISLIRIIMLFAAEVLLLLSVYTAYCRKYGTMSLSLPAHRFAVHQTAKQRELEEELNLHTERISHMKNIESETMQTEQTE